MLDAEWGTLSDHDEPTGLEGERMIRYREHRRREPKLREAKIRKMRESRGRVYCEVPGCGFDFEAIYGSLGRDFAHVHHINALAERDGASITTLDDLVVVCVNCHAMIHRGGECRDYRTLLRVRDRDPES